MEQQVKKVVKATEPSAATKVLISSILEVMKEKEITPRMLCFDTGIDEGQFSRWVNHKASFSMEKVQEILSYLEYELTIVPKSRN